MGDAATWPLQCKIARAIFFLLTSKCPSWTEVKEQGPNYCLAKRGVAKSAGQGASGGMRNKFCFRDDIKVGIFPFK